MGLLRLLSTGSSLARMRDVGRYHLTQQAALPTFGNVKKFQAAEAKVSGASEALAVGKQSVSTPPASGAWWKPKNPFVAHEKPVQSELSLDKVKVVRSDLSDADVVIMPKAPAGTTIPERRYVRPERQPDDLGKKAWSLLGSRLFGDASVKH